MIPVGPGSARCGARDGCWVLHTSNRNWRLEQNEGGLSVFASSSQQITNLPGLYVFRKLKASLVLTSCLE